MTSKKVLIITYYWPPAGGPGVQRWLKFSRYLPEFGWEPIIYTPENPSYPIVDETLLAEIPKGIKMVKTKIWEPYQLAEKLNRNNKKFKAGQFDVGKNQSWKSRLSIWIRGNFFIPDARKYWVKPSVKFLKKYLQENKIETIVTTGPPHSLHLIGRELKKQNPALKWLADFRDPWTEISYYKHLKLTKKSDRKHHQLEEDVFRNADITLATSYTDAENFKKKGACAICITNGFDAMPKTDIEHSKRSEKFTLSYVGVLEQLRNPEILWEVLVELLHENEDFRKNFKLKFVGKVDDRILNTIEKSSLAESLDITGYLPHDQSLEEMQKASLLLLTNFPNEVSKGIIPGKIFEYLSTGNPILSFGPKNSDVEKILEKTHAGKHFGYSDSSALKTWILQQYENWKKGIPPKENLNIEAFSRKNLTEKLSEIL
ncbi:glycosyl transferase family 1 [Daejeonia sp. YH14]|uniref:glycosyl transferase family 1 n=1 Tax=Daejeonia sp. YH14 TaxID=3439042 RepID=UPI003F49231C